MTSKKFPIYSFSISGLISLQLHALNNEGNEGNQSMTRRYYIIEKGDSEPKFVNGISGDMLKHIQSEHLQKIALQEGLNLSEGGKRLDPDRVGYDVHKIANFFSASETDLHQKINKILTVCSISDLEGFMITEKKGQTLKRDSIIEFGTVVGVPTFVKTQSYFHAKYGTENPTPFNVQVNSGHYATVLNVEASRIGYNPHTFDYAINATERKQRLDALLKSILYTYLQPNGAKRNTLLPHPDSFEGVITLSTRRCPAPMISPLDVGYLRQIDSISQTLNLLNGEGTIHQFPFESMAEFAQRIETIIQQSTVVEAS
jgi:CRISPR-associated protein Cst2